LVPDSLLGELNNILLGNSTNNTLDLSGAHAASGGDDLASDVLSNSGGSVQRQKEGSLKLGLGTLNLRLSDGLGHAVPLTESEMNKVVDVGEVVGDHVSSPESGVGVGGAEAHERVGKVVLVEHGRELGSQVGSVTKGTVEVTDDGLGNEGGEVVGVLPADTLNSDGDVGGGDGVVTHANLRSDEVGLRSTGGSDGDGRGGGLKSREVLLSQLNELLVGDSSGTNKDHAVSLVVGVDVLLKVGLLDGKDVLLRSEDGAAESLSLESSGVKVVEDNLLELLVDLLLLANDNLTLALDRGLLQLGVLENVGDDLDGLSDVILERLGVVDGLLTLIYCQFRYPLVPPSNVPKYRRSSVLPCSQSRVPTAAGYACWCPVRPLVLVPTFDIPALPRH
jgi:hypothetical protein